MLPNRIAIYLTAAAGLCTALAPAVANLDLTSTVGAVGGLAAVAAVVHKFLEGWQKYEERADLEALNAPDETAVPDLPAA